MQLSESYERWTDAGPIVWPCAGVDIFENGDLTLLLLFSEVIGGSERDLRLHFGRVIALSSHEELSHPWMDEPVNNIPKLSGNWEHHAYPVLRVLDSSVLASFSAGRLGPYEAHDVTHLRVVTLDKTVDVLARAPITAEWVPGRMPSTAANP